MIKIIALITMLIDHVGEIFFPHLVILNLIGRLTFPLFAFEIAEGARRTKNFPRYAVRLLLLAIISQYPYQILFENGVINVCFTLLAGLLTIRLIEAKLPFFLRLLITLVIFVVAHFMELDYGIYGIIMIVIFYLCRENSVLLLLLQSVNTIFGTALYDYHLTQLAAILAIPLIEALKRYDIRVNKYIFYIFYPTHLMLLYFIEQYCINHHLL